MNKCYSKICKEYKTELRKKVSFCKRRNKSFKKRIFKIKGIIVQSGGTNELEQLAGIKIIDQEVERNNKLMSEYIEQLKSIYSEVTNKTANVSSEELAAFTEKLNLKEEMVLGQFEKIKSEVNAVKIQNATIIEENQLKIKQLDDEIDMLKRKSEEQATSSLSQSSEEKTKIAQLQKNIDELNIQNSELQQKSSQSDESNRAKIEELNNTIKGLQDTNLGKDILNDSVKEKYDLLVEENNNLKKKISSMEELKTQLTECQTTNQQCKQADTRLKNSLPQAFETYNDQLVKYVTKREQAGGKRRRIVCRLPRYINKLDKYYNSYSKAKNNYISKCIKIYAKKKGITLTKIKNELRYLFKNRGKYIKKVRLFRGGKYDNELVTSLLSKQQVPDQYFEEIYQQLKSVIKGTSSSSSDEGRDIMNDVYLSVLGKSEDELTKSEQRFMNKAVSITDIGKEIIAITSDCDPNGQDVLLKASIDTIKSQAKVLDKLVNLIKTSVDNDIINKAKMYLPTDSPVALSGSASQMINTIDTYFRKIIQQKTNALDTAFATFSTEFNKNWRGDKNADIKRVLCKSIDILKKLLLQISRELDLSYIVNKFEDISGAVRVYVRINDFAVSVAEKKGNFCKTCLGRSYTIRKQDEQETTYIQAQNPCTHDPFYNANQLDNAITNKTTDGYTIIDQALLEKNNMSNYLQYGPFFGTYENVTNSEIFNGISTKKNNPPLKDALLQATQGYSIVLFGYGYSGSGKSFTLLNGYESILFNVMKEVKDEIGGKVEIDEISELYGRCIYKEGKPISVKANKIEITEEDLQGVDINSSRQSNEKELPNVDFKIINEYDKTKREDQINAILKSIEQLRSSPRKVKVNGQSMNLPATIKATPNNPISSRSHLFITLKITGSGENPESGYLTLVDMAGIEDPTEIAINIFPFEDLRNLIWPFSDISPLWSKIDITKFTTSKKAQDLLVDAFYNVSEDMLWSERDLCTKRSGQGMKKFMFGKEATNLKRPYSNISLNWKFIRECYTGSNFPGNSAKFRLYKSNEDNVEMNGYPQPNIFKIKIMTDKRLKEIFSKIISKNSNYMHKDVAKDVNKLLKELNQYSEKMPTTQEEKIEMMKKFRGDLKDQILTKGEALTLLSDIKEAYYYNIYDSTQVKNINKVLKRWETMLTPGKNPWRYIKAVNSFKVGDKERLVKEKCIMILNYCFGCLILNGILQDYFDLENKTIDYVDGVKFLTVQGKKVSVDYKQYTELIQEGIYINETINHLSFYFKKKNKPSTKLNNSSIFVEQPNRFHSDKFKTRDKTQWTKNIMFTLKAYLPNKFLYNPTEKSDRFIKIRNILDYLDQKGTPGKPSKFIMMCLLRPEIDAKFCSGARNTLTFAESVCSTCT